MKDTTHETHASTQAGAQAPAAAARPYDDMLLTPEQLGRMLNVTRRTLSNWVKAGLIPMIRVGRICRFDHAKVMAVLEKSERPTASR